LILVQNFLTTLAQFIRPSLPNRDGISALTKRPQRPPALGATALLALSLPAQATTVLHISNSGTADKSPQDPAFLSSNRQFFVDNVSGQSAAGPTTLYFLRPYDLGAPSISSIMLTARANNGTIGATTAVTFGPFTDTGLNFNASSGDLSS
jgi:hypothetical protein